MSLSLTVEPEVVEITVDLSNTGLTVSSSPVSIEVNAESNDITVTPNEMELTVSNTLVGLVVNSSTVEIVTVAEQGPQGVPGPSGTVEVDESLVSLEWGTPTAESGNAIEVTGSLKTLTGDPLVSSVVDIQVVVTDSATDAEPSATATLAAASTPVGTVLAGSGTATMTIRTDAGQLAIRASEPSAAHRYLWLRNGGHSRLWIRSLTGVQELVFA